MRSMKQMDTEDEAAAPDIPSPISADGEKHDERELSALHSTDLGSPSLSYDFSNVRVRMRLCNSHAVYLETPYTDQVPS